MKLSIGLFGLNVSLYLFWFDSWGYDENSLNLILFSLKRKE